MQRRFSKIFQRKDPSPVTSIYAVNGEIGSGIKHCSSDSIDPLEDDTLRASNDSIHEDTLTHLFDKFDTAQGGIENYIKQTEKNHQSKQLLVELRTKLDHYEKDLKEFETNLYNQESYLIQKTEFLEKFQKDLKSKEIVLDGLVGKDHIRDKMVMAHYNDVSKRFLNSYSQKIVPCKFMLENLNYYIKTLVEGQEDIKPNESILKLLHPREYQEFLDLLDNVHEIYLHLNRL